MSASPFLAGSFFDPRAVGLTPGAALYTYAAGTLTPLATFTGPDGLSANTNPVICSVNGQADVFMGASAYKLRLYTDLITNGGTLIDEWDNVASARSQVTGDLANSANVALGDALMAVKHTATGAVARTQHEVNEDAVSIKTFGALGGGADDSQAFRDANATGKAVFVPAGTWKCNVLNLAGGVFFGEGETSIITPYDVDVRCFGCDSGSASTFIDGLELRNLRFLGTIVDDAFSEQCHLVWVNGVRRLRVIDCYFTGFRGDGLYIGSGPGGGSERHNHDVIVRGCHFDGIDSNNRNGISVIDVDGILIEGCTFRRMSNALMPGPIDFEPDNSFGVIKNVRIVNNEFHDTDALNAHITFATQYTTNVGNWYIAGNIFTGYDGIQAIMMNLAPATFTQPMGIVVENNIGISSTGTFLYKRAGDTNGITIADNICYGLRGVWFSRAGDTPIDSNLSITGNEFFGVGATSVGLILTEEMSGVDIRANLFPYSGNYHILIGGNGPSEYISICDNTFRGTPSSGDISHTSTVKNALTNTCLGNTWGSSHTFEAAKTDFVGSVQNTTDAREDALPSAFPYGKSMTRLSARTIDGASQTGMLYTHKEYSGLAASWWQEFIPDYSATYKDDRFFRKAVDASNWDAWWQVTGT